MKIFAFTDSSGILSSDRFFGTGLLVVQNVGDMVDKLYKNSQPAKARAKKSKMDAVDALISSGKNGEAIRMLRGNYRFEMKFDNVGSGSTLPFYESMVDIFLADPNNRFSAMIVDRQNPQFDDGGMGDSWESYTKYIAMLVAREMENLPTDEICLVVDEISKPRTKALSLEDTVMNKIRAEAAGRQNINADNIFGCLTIESHSNLLMQLCDVLLGAVMYDYKDKSGLNTPRTHGRKGPFVQKFRSNLGVQTLAAEFVSQPSAYFEVSECV